ncbi:hypothetical protein L1887_47831 [Cichorium endivia]|nr:hypothetical protein L1887_47831 [Cichorium endivia]
MLQDGRGPEPAGGCFPGRRLGQAHAYQSRATPASASGTEATQESRRADDASRARARPSAHPSQRSPERRKPPSRPKKRPSRDLPALPTDAASSAAPTQTVDNTAEATEEDPHGGCLRPLPQAHQGGVAAAYLACDCGGCGGQEFHGAASIAASLRDRLSSAT